MRGRPVRVRGDCWSWFRSLGGRTWPKVYDATCAAAFALSFLDPPRAARCTGRGRSTLEFAVGTGRGEHAGTCVLRIDSARTRPPDDSTW